MKPLKGKHIKIRIKVNRYCIIVIEDKPKITRMNLAIEDLALTAHRIHKKSTKSKRNN